MFFFTVKRLSVINIKKNAVHTAQNASNRKCKYSLFSSPPKKNQLTTLCLICLFTSFYFTLSLTAVFSFLLYLVGLEDFSSDICPQDVRSIAEELGKKLGTASFNFLAHLLISLRMALN